jgi:hypothetical protein
MSGYGMILAGALLIGTAFSAKAQGTYAAPTRNGQGVGTANGSSTSNTSSTVPSYAAPAARNGGTGQGRTEGAMGLSPQLQREMGIPRQ